MGQREQGRKGMMSEGWERGNKGRKGKDEGKKGHREQGKKKREG